MNAKTLQEFADGINSYLKAHPKHADLPVITSADDEGNGFNRVYYDPSHSNEWDTGTEQIEGVCVS